MARTRDTTPDTPTAPAALRLNLGGAPATWHVVVGLPGLYHPEIPTLLRVVGLDADAALAAASDPGCHVEIADVVDEDAAEAALRDALSAARLAAAAGIQQAEGGESEQARDEAVAVAAAVETTTPPADPALEG